MKIASRQWTPFLVATGLASVFGTADCTFDASQLRPLADGAVQNPAVPDAGAAGSGGTTISAPDAQTVAGGSGSYAGVSATGGAAQSGGQSGESDAGGSGAVGGLAGADTGVAGSGGGSGGTVGQASSAGAGGNTTSTSATVDSGAGGFSGTEDGGLGDSVRDGPFGATYDGVGSLSSDSSDDSADVPTTPICTSPATPANLSATRGVGQVVLNWTASTGATSYDVRRATVSGGPYASIVPAAGVTTGSTYTDSAVTNDTTYYYVVTARNGAGSACVSGQAAQASATPRSCQTVLAGSVMSVTLKDTANCFVTCDGVQPFAWSCTNFGLADRAIQVNGQLVTPSCGVALPASRNGAYTFNIAASTAAHTWDVVFW
ncbi:MAG TPA: hypothetical protein VJ801_14180, partial [Polyangia bacterium]|nr:hypothetical protein [Polyangia bacterium]